MKNNYKDSKKAPKAEIHLHFLRAILKKVLNQKTPGHDGIFRF